MTEASDELSRLADALDAYLARDASVDETDSTYVARHPHLRDLLEPMLGPTGEPAGAPEAIGPYRVVRELGRGGMGVVYEAVHDALHRTVALKVLPSLLSVWPKRVERFLREAAAAARLDHPGIARVFDAGEADGVFYFAMERVAGRTLRDALRAVQAECGRDPRHLADRPQLGCATTGTRAEEVAAVGATVADALAHAHDHGVVHRDVKPQNLMVTADGALRLVDFGLAKELADDVSVSDGFAGTPHYSSPEQIEPSPAGVDGRADVFGLGVVLYELLALRRPFDAASREGVLRAVTSEEPRPLRAFDPRVPRDLEAVVLVAIEKDPAARYQSAADLATDLRRFLRGEPVRARRSHWLRRTGRWVRRKPAVALAIGLAFALVSVAPSLALFYSARSAAAIERERDIAVASFGTARRAVRELLQRVGAQELADTPHMQRLRGELLEEASRCYDDLLAAAGPRPGVELLLEAARVDVQAGSVLFDLAEPAAAREAFDRAVARAEAVLVDEPRELDGRAMLAAATAGRAVVSYVFRPSDADEDECGTTDLARSRALWAELCGELPADPRSQVAILRGAIHAELRWVDGVWDHDRESAAGAVDEARAILERAPPIADPSLLTLAGEVHLKAAALASERGEGQAALAACAEAGEALESARRSGRQLARVRSLEARRLQMLAELENGDEARYRAAIDAWQALVDDYPSIPAFRRSLAAALNDWAGRFLLADRPDDAAPLVARATELAARLAADEGTIDSRLRLLRCRSTSLMQAVMSGADSTAAALELDRSIADLTAVADADPQNGRVQHTLGAALSNRAVALLRLGGDPDHARDLLERAVAAQRVAMERAPRDRNVQRYLLNHYRMLVAACFRLDDAVAAREALVAERPLVDDPDRLWAGAALLMRCVRMGDAEAVGAALDTLERAESLRGGAFERAAAEPQFEPLHHEPRFVERLRRLHEDGR